MRGKSGRIATWMMMVMMAFTSVAAFSACESNPVVKEAMDGDDEKVLGKDKTNTENLEEDNVEGAKMPGMPENTDNVLPGAK